MEESKTRKIMFVNRKAPHGSIYAYEGLEVILIFGAYDQEISAVFLDDAVLSLKKGQDNQRRLPGRCRSLPEKRAGYQ